MTPVYDLPPVCRGGAMNQLLSNVVRLAAALDYGGREMISFPEHWHTEGAKIGFETLLDMSLVERRFPGHRTDDVVSMPIEMISCEQDDDRWWKKELILPKARIKVDPTTKIENTKTKIDTQTRKDDVKSPRQKKTRSSKKQVDKITKSTTVVDILKRFRPTTLLEDLVNEKLKAFDVEDKDAREGVCVHNPNGQRWRRFCDRLSKETNSTLGKHCQGYDGRPVADLVLERLPDHNYEKNKAIIRTIYYVGDEDPPESLDVHFRVLRPRSDVAGDKRALKRLGIEITDDKDVSQHGDILDLLDYYTCLRMHSFVGNSLSTFTALQLLHRNGNGSWYNSGPVPLSDFLPIRVPIVYTYTGESQPAGKILLKASMRSSRSKLGRDQPIHLLYHGKGTDNEFSDWLSRHDVIVHEHHPKWTDTMEKLRKAGNKKTSHLFKHKGNYLGTWQRIDVPFFVESEYVLYLDADTLIDRFFSLGDFDHNLTASAVAFAQEAEFILEPANAGVTFYNVPRLRTTYPEFVEFIADVANPANNRTFSMPSDQGANKDFYDPVLLNVKFNLKPYYKRWSEYERVIVHFHGPKPDEFLKFFVGRQVNPLMKEILKRADDRSNSLCDAMMLFANALKGERSLLEEYCSFNFQNNDVLKPTCELFLDSLPKLKTSTGCNNVAMNIYKMIREKKITVSDAIATEPKPPIKNTLKPYFRKHGLAVSKHAINDFDFVENLVDLFVLAWYLIFAYMLLKCGKISCRLCGSLSRRRRTKNSRHHA